MPRLQFSLKTLLWLMAVAAAFSAGQQFEKRRLEWAWRAVEEADQELAEARAERREQKAN